MIRLSVIIAYLNTVFNDHTVHRAVSWKYTQSVDSLALSQGNIDPQIILVVAFIFTVPKR